MVEAAILDLLTRQRDRNARNIFISKSGNIKLIDNNSAFGSEVSSVMLPATRLHTLASLGNKYMYTGKPEDVNKFPTTSIRLDYRCHSKPYIGKGYPKGFADCMERIRSYSTPSLMRDLGLESIVQAKTLIQSASDLMEMGFEWTLYNGGPSSEGGGLYPQEVCCGFDSKFSRYKRTFGCEDEWYPHQNIHEKYVYNN